MSWQPRVTVLDGFLSARECALLISFARKGLKPSTVVDTSTGDSIADEWRTSSGYFLSEEEEHHWAVEAINDRISLFSQTPAENGEPMQVLRYTDGQFYKPHEDFIYPDKTSNVTFASRVATVVMYLTDGVVGGETWFVNGTGSCGCGGEEVGGVSVQPKMGRAVLFWNTNLWGEADPTAMHAGCKVVGGEKWSATKWIGAQPWG